MKRMKRIVVYMLAAIGAVSIPAMVFGAFWAYGMYQHTHGKCDILLSRLKDETVRKHLIEWVAQHVETADAADIRVISDTGRAPSGLHVDMEFDWEILGFDPQLGQVRLIGPDWPFDEWSISDVQSVSFSDVTRAAILVKLSDRAKFGVEPRDITETSEEAAVYCAWGD